MPRSTVAPSCMPSNCSRMPRIFRRPASARGRSMLRTKTAACGYAGSELLADAQHLGLLADAQDNGGVELRQLLHTWALSLLKVKLHHKLQLPLLEATWPCRWRRPRACSGGHVVRLLTEHLCAGFAPARPSGHASPDARDAGERLGAKGGNGSQHPHSPSLISTGVRSQHPR